MEVRNAISQAIADGAYLKLDASNGPITGNLQMEHIGIKTAPTAGHDIFIDETYTGSGTVVGIGCFPKFLPTVNTNNNIISVQGNVWFGTTNWTTVTGVQPSVRALDFFPAPDASGVGSADLLLTGIAVGGLLNLVGRVVTADIITGIGISPIAHLDFGFPFTDNTTANAVRGLVIVSAAATLGTWGRLTGIEVEAQTSGAVNQGIWLHSDNDGGDLCFGAGSGVTPDVNMYYDGTDFLLFTDLLNPSDFVLDCGTNKTLEFAETVWEDARIPIGAMINGATPPGLGTFFGSVSVLMFDPGTDEEVYLTIQIPHRYKEGTNIIAHVHWAPTSTNTGNVLWALEYQWQNLGQAFAGASTTITILDAGNGVTGEHQVAEFPAITGTGKDISSMLCCRLYRDASDGTDTYTGDAALLEFDIHFEVDTLGSRQEFTK